MLMVSRITPCQVVARMEKGEPVRFVDARKEAGAGGPKLAGAVRVSLPSIVRDSTDVPRSSLVVVYGRDERELDVPRIADALRAMGCREVKILAGGLTAWLDLHYPVQAADALASA